MSKRTGSDQFEVRLGRMRSASGGRRLQGFLKKVAFGAKQVARSRRTYTTAVQSRFHRRVIVKITSVKMSGHGAAVQAKHLDYIERQGAGENDTAPELYSDIGADVDSGAFLEAGQADRHQFRVIISPEDAHELEDLTAFTQDLVKEMEHDLGTKLDWVAANHYDTDQPHTHLVIRGQRDDGADLVMPRRYITHGIRESAQELATLELGPVSEIAGRTRLALMVQQERWTELDQRLSRLAKDGAIDLTLQSQQRGDWRQPLYKQRLQKLETLCLAEPVGRGRWKIASEAEATLRRMGERGDILKALHRINQQAQGRAFLDGTAIFDPTDTNTKSVTGQIIQKGMADDVQDRAFIVIDSMDGKPVYVGIGGEMALIDYQVRMIVTVAPPNMEPRPSDFVIARIAQTNGNHYSEELHMNADTRAQPEFVQAHVRRLEAMRRAGHVSRSANGDWAVPSDYLDRARAFEKAAALRKPADIKMQSSLTLAQMKTAIGSTWLDAQLRDHDDSQHGRGFGRDLQEARVARRQFLVAKGFAVKDPRRLPQSALDALKREDLKSAAAEVSKRLGKHHGPVPEGQRIEGIYREAIDRPSGKFAVIECAKDFSLVPWREVLERNRWKAVSGLVRGNDISWRITRARSIS